MVRAYRKFLIPDEPELSPAHRAMLLFLDHPDAFDFAWSRYLLFASSSQLSVHHVPVGTLEFGSSQQAGLERDMSHYFAEQDRGEHCRVAIFEEEGEQVLLIRHGAHVRTITYWEADQVSTHSLRPAVEDVLVYEPDTQLLRVKAGLPKDREAYVRLWCRWIARDEGLTEAALETEVYSLVSLQEGRFQFAGDGPVLNVQLRRVTMKLATEPHAVLQIAADDVNEVLRYGPEGLDLGTGLLLAVRLRFVIKPKGARMTTVTFDIAPPLRTNLAQKRYVDLNERYLAEQGVKLR